MSTIKTICNSGCGQEFEVGDMQIAQLGDGIEKTYFNCPHCQHEYVAFYTDEEIRRLQQKIRKTLGKTVDPKLNLAAAIRREMEIMKQVERQKQIVAEKMDALRASVEAVK